MRPVIFSLLLLGWMEGFAQQYNVPDSIPPFNIMLGNRSYFNASNLKPEEKLLIVYFDPDCSHCKHFTSDLVKNISKLNHVQVVMICAAGLSAVKAFTDSFHLNKYPCIKAGTEGIYRTVMYYYHVQVTPFAALYDSRGKLLVYYRNSLKIQDIIRQFNHSKPI